VIPRPRSPADCVCDQETEKVDTAQPKGFRAICSSNNNNNDDDDDDDDDNYNNDNNDNNDDDDDDNYNNNVQRSVQQLQYST
jgi:hypothetical protein